MTPTSKRNMFLQLYMTIMVFDSFDIKTLNIKDELRENLI